jgi:hypothetical protein
LRADRLPLRVALATGATLATLLVCEAAARWLLPPPRYHREPLELDAALGFRGIPHFREELEDELGRYTFELDAEGLRGRDLPAAAAPDGVSRWLLVGDSFLVGHAVREEALVASRLEAALRARGRPVEVYNLAAPDYGTAQELLLLRRLGPALAPEQVVLFVYPANDLANNSMLLAGRTEVSAGDPIRPYLVPGADGGLELRQLHPIRAVLRRHSRLFALLERRVLASLGGGPPAEDPAQRMRQGRAPREDLEIFREHRDPGEAWARAWESTFALLRAFRAECDAMGARLLVVVVPSVHQVVRNAKGIGLDVAARLARGRPLDAILDWELPERRFARFFADEGIEARFLLEPLRGAARAGERVYGRDEHLSARGHEIAAASVLDAAAARAVSVASGPAAAPSHPVRLIQGGAAGRSLLDFRADPHLDHLGDGWIAWSPAGSDGPGGWLVGPSALVVLAAGPGDLVLRGVAPARESYPLDAASAIVGTSPRRFRLDGPGRFELRFPMGSAGDAGLPSAEGMLAVIVASGTAEPGRGVAATLRIEALGLEPALSSSGD